MGMILPFLINSTAVFVFRQFFSCPRSCSPPPRSTAPASCGSCGRSRCRLVKPAVLTTILLTFIGPWNEFLWPFLVTKDTEMQPLAVTLANYISNIAGRAANPYGAILAEAVVLAAPAVTLFVAFRALHRVRAGSGVKG